MTAVEVMRAYLNSCGPGVAARSQRLTMIGGLGRS
jgi:hypothetical protein